MHDSLASQFAARILDVLKQPVVLVGWDGRLMHVNRAARRSIGDPLQRQDFDLAAFLEDIGVRNVDITVIRIHDSGDADLLYSRGGEDPGTLAARERQAILERLEATGWRLAETARQLGISRTTLWRRLRTYGFTRGDGES